MSEEDVQPNGQAPGLSVDQAWATILQACASFTGNLKDHQTIQQSLELVGRTLNEARMPMPNRETRRAAKS